jgi:hypothetical protein
MSVPPQRAEEVLARFRHQRPEAARLAELVCLATRIEAGLLREARLHLAPGLDAGAESDLWFSPLVESWSARAFVLSPAAASLLQTQLLEDKARAQRAWALIKQFHSRVPPIIALGERVTWLALSRGTEALPEIERELQTVLRTMLHDERQGPGVARWALRALSRFPPLVQATSAAKLLAFGAVARLGKHSLAQSTVSLPPQGAHWLLPQPDSEQQSEIRLMRSREGLTFLSGEEHEHELHLVVPRTEPVLLEVLWQQGDQEHHQLVEPKPGTTLPIPPGITSIRLRMVSGDEYELTANPPQEGAPAPAYLDQTIWQSCVWIPGPDRTPRATGFFIDPSVIVTAASLFPSLMVNASVEIVWQGLSYRASLLQINYDAGYALFKLPEGSPRATPVTGEAFPGLEQGAFAGAPIRPWMGYAMLQEEQYWIEGTYHPPPFFAQSATVPSPFLAVRGSTRIEDHLLPVGLPIFLDGFVLVGHINEWIGNRPILGRTQEAIQFLREPADPGPPDVEDSSPATEDRIEELRRLILNDGSVESQLEAQVRERLGPLREITSDRLPSEDHKATINSIGPISRLSLDTGTINLTSENSAGLRAQAEIDEVSLTLYLPKADYWRVQAEESKRILILTNPDWDERHVEAVTFASLRLAAHVVIGTETPEGGTEMISSVYLSGLEHIEVIDFHRYEPEPAEQAPAEQSSTKKPKARPKGDPQKTTSKRSSAKKGAKRTASKITKLK